MTDLRAYSAEELLSEYAKLAGGHDIYYRDLQLMRGLLEEGFRPTQILEWIHRYAAEQKSDGQSLYFRQWAYSAPVEMQHDELLAEVDLVRTLMACGSMPTEQFPSCVYIYIDNVAAAGVPSAGVERAWEAAKLELESWLDDRLGQAAASYGGARSAKRSASRAKRPAVNHPERLDR